MKTNQLTLLQAAEKATKDKACSLERKFFPDKTKSHFYIVCSPTGFMCDYHFNMGTCLKHPGLPECEWCQGRFPLDKGCLNGCTRLKPDYILTPVGGGEWIAQNAIQP